MGMHSSVGSIRSSTENGFAGWTLGTTKCCHSDLLFESDECGSGSVMWIWISNVDLDQ